MSFKNIKPGDRVAFTHTFKRVVVAQVNPLLIFDTHVVVNHGNNGKVVNDTNFLYVIKGQA